MSRETAEWLQRNTLIGHTDERGPAWHNDPTLRAALGIEDNHFPGAVPLDRIEKLLDFELLSCSVRASGTFLSPEGDPIEIDTVDNTRQAIVTSDTQEILGVFREGYQIHHYRAWLIDALSDLVGDPMAQDKGLDVYSVGLLRNRAICYVQVALPAEMILPGFLIRPYVSGATSANGRLASQFWCGNQAVVCDNTLDAGVRERVPRIKIKHSRNSLGKIEDIAQVLGILDYTTRGFKAIMQALADTPIREADTEKYINLRFGNRPESGKGVAYWDKAHNKFMNLVSNDPRVEMFRGTAASLFQADNTYRLWSKGIKSSATSRGGLLERTMWQDADGTNSAEDKMALSTINQVLRANRKAQIDFNALVPVMA